MTDLRKPCRCECGYRCGGPGRCKLDPLECLAQDEGHFVKDCDHDFSGPLVAFDSGSYSVVCQKCGMAAASHDSWRGP